MRALLRYRCSSYFVSNRANCHPLWCGEGRGERGMKPPGDRNLQHCYGLTIDYFSLAKQLVCVQPKFGSLVFLCISPSSSPLSSPSVCRQTDITLALWSDLALTWASIWFTCPEGISTSYSQVITLYHCHLVTVHWAKYEKLSIFIYKNFYDKLMT